MSLKYYYLCSPYLVGEFQWVAIIFDENFNTLWDCKLNNSEFKTFNKIIDSNTYALLNVKSEKFSKVSRIKLKHGKISPYY